MQLEWSGQIAQVWIRFYFPPWLFVLSLGVIITSAVTLRYRELPVIFYVVFPYVGSNLMLLIFWQCYDMLRVIRASEGVLRNLSQHHVPYLQGLARAERIQLIKRSRAMRPLVILWGTLSFLWVFQSEPGLKYSIRLCSSCLFNSAFLATRVD